MDLQNLPVELLLILEIVGLEDIPILAHLLVGVLRVLSRG